LSVVVESGDLLGESPMWIAGNSMLAWVDIDRRRLQGYDGREVWAMEVPLKPGCAVPSSAGGYVMAAKHGFYRLDPATGAISDLASVAAQEPPGTYFNDGKCDPQGRFWAGTVQSGRRAFDAGLYRLEAGGEPEKVLDGIGVSNGIGWSPDGATMFHVDTARRRLDAFDFDPRSGGVSERRMVVDLAEHRGGPDGLTVDSEGGIWIAMWQGGAVLRYTADGILDRTVEFPVSQPTSCVFGGSEMGDLFVTSARRGLSATALASEALAGHVFRVEAGVTGMPSVAFAG
jgi:sugar lactone lactonase YvrE